MTTFTLSAGAMERVIHLNAVTPTVKAEICLGDLAQDSWVKFECDRNPKTCCLWRLEEANDILKLGVVHIEEKLREKAFLSNSALGSFSISPDAGETIRIERSGRIMSFIDLETKVKAELERLNGLYDQGYELQELKLTQGIITPLTGVNKISFSKSRIQALATFQVVAEDGTILGSSLAKLQNIRPVILTTHALRAGDPINEKDLAIKTVDVFQTEYSSQLQSSASDAIKASQLGELTQVRARMAMRDGQILLSSNLDRAPLVKSGDTVTLLLTSDNLRISTKGHVQSTASLGDTVTVNLKNYGRTFRGTLKEGKVVEVFL